MAKGLKKAKFDEAARHFEKEYFKALSKATSQAISPLFIYPSLGILLINSTGSIKETLSKNLKLDATNDDIMKRFRRYLCKYRLMKGIKYACRLCVEKSHETSNETIELLSRTFRHKLKYINLKAKTDEADMINAWFESKLNEKLVPFIDLTPLNHQNSVFFVSAAVFETNWLYPFLPSNTQNRPFYTQSGNTKQVETMVSNKIKVPVLEASAYLAVELPYDDKHHSMIILLPNSEKTVEDIFEFDAKEIRKRMKKREITISLPKFSIEINGSASSVLKEMNLDILFTEGKVDLSKLTDTLDSANVFDIFHKSLIRVTEGAGSKNVKSDRSESPNDVIEVNRSFVFGVFTYTNRMLFVGVVQDPTIDFIKNNANKRNNKNSSKRR